jgi:CelD/BcsL family acetyltransferase involved in cellulose biosynthesis
MPATEYMQPEAAATAIPHVVVIDDVQEFSGLREEWQALLQASATDSPFLTWEWLHAWWTHLRGGRDLRLLTVRAADRLIGLAPLSISRRRLPWLSQLEFLGTGWAGSDYLDVIIRRDFEGRCLDAMTDSYRSQRRTLRLDHLPGERAHSASLADRLTASGWTAQTTRSGICPFARLTGHSWDSYMATLRPSHQTRYRRYLGTLNKKFTVSFEQATSEAQRHEALSALMTFHEQRWTPRGGSTAFQTPALRAFHHDATARMLLRGWLRLFVLRLNDKPAAVAYCFAYNGRFYLYQHGFDEQFRRYSVGLALLGLTIHAAIEEGASEFDMLYGDEPYKSLWARDIRPLERIELFPSHIGGRIHHHTVEAERSMRTLARRIFPRRPCDSNVPHAGVAS